MVINPCKEYCFVQQNVFWFDNSKIPFIRRLHSRKPNRLHVNSANFYTFILFKCKYRSCARSSASVNLLYGKEKNRLKHLRALCCYEIGIFIRLKRWMVKGKNSYCNCSNWRCLLHLLRRDSEVCLGFRLKRTHLFQSWSITLGNKDEI